MIRLAKATDIEAIQTMERAANALFRGVRMEDVATLQPTSVQELQSLIDLRQAWVWADEDDEPFANVLVTVEGPDAHVEQVTVHPSHERRGYGRRLLDHVSVWAAQRGLTGVTLTTFTQVPWRSALAVPGRAMTPPITAVAKKVVRSMNYS